MNKCMVFKNVFAIAASLLWFDIVHAAGECTRRRRPPHFSLNKCKSQRNLIVESTAQAKAIDSWLAAQARRHGC